MKRIMTMLLIACLLLSVCACAEAAGSFSWTREGTFADENGDFLSVIASDDGSNPGWYVGCVLGEDMYGAIIQQEGETLHGNIDTEGGEFIVTIAEDGDGLLMTLENGETYHFAQMEIQEAALVVTVNTEGFGQIAYAEGSEAPVFDDEYPSQSAYLGLQEPGTYTFAAKADEGYRFVKWTRDGETFATDEQITVELTESADYVAVFMVDNPYAGEAVSDIASAKTIGDVLDLTNGEYSATETTYVTAVELNDIVYRVEAAMDAETAEAFFNLDFDDPDYQKKFTELVSPLAITGIENLSENIPSQEELDALVGKTCEDLLNDGWTISGWDLDNSEVYMNHGPYAFSVIADGASSLSWDVGEEEFMPLTVTSITCIGIGDAMVTEDPELN